MIQKIHRIWFGPDPMPENYQEFGQKWKDLNPEWEVIDWTEEMVQDIGIINQDIWDHLGTPGLGETVHPIALATQRADVLDYELIYRFGGLYVNTDIEPVRPLSVMFDNNLPMHDMAAAGFEIDEWVVNAAMWAPFVEMPFWAHVIDAMPERYYSRPGDYMSNTTGPHLLTQVWREHYEMLYTFEKDTFNPIYFPEVELGKDAVFNFDDLPAVTIGVHHWGHRKNMRPQTSKV
jgi:mannosyltransferase OCH1-like enzyme